MNTKVLLFGGVHGCGKSSTLKSVAHNLMDSGFSVYVLPEMNIVPNIKIGTPEFQLWYKKQLSIRERIISHLAVGLEIVDYILCDRTIYDTLPYDWYLFGWKSDSPSRSLYIDRGIDHIHENDWVPNYDPSIFILDMEEYPRELIEKRYVDQPHRKKWNENEEKYWYQIRDGFRDLMMSSRLQKRRLYHINNVIGNHEETVNNIMRKCVGI